MSLQNPHKDDDLISLLDTYLVFICDPKVNKGATEYFFDLADETLKLLRTQVLNGK